MNEIKQASIYMRVLWYNDNENLRPETLNIKLDGENTEEVTFSISQNDNNVDENAPWEASKWANGITYNYQKEQQEVKENEEIQENNIPYVIPSIIDDINIQNYRKNIIKNAEKEEYAYYTIKMTYVPPKPRKARMMSARSTSPSLIFNGTTIENVNFNGVELDKVVFNGTIVFEKKNASFADIILANSTVNEGAPNFSLIATTDEGLWTMEDDYGTSYYFRGAIENNYVKFGGFYWRIIRINGDGSLRIIYDGKQAYANGTNSIDRYAVTNKEWNTKSNDAKYVGYMYSPSGTTASISKEEAQTNLINSNIKTAIDNWYNTNIVVRGYETYISDNIFWNDRSITSGTGYGTNTTNYGGYQRLERNKDPKFICSEKNDAFTVNASEKSNGALTYPVGIITADEVVTAGGRFSVQNKNFYLYNPNSYTVTLTPYDVSSGSAAMFGISLGKLYSVFASGGNGTSPVINLKADVEVTGTGTMNDPYVVVGAE